MALFQDFSVGQLTVAGNALNSLITVQERNSLNQITRASGTAAGIAALAAADNVARGAILMGTDDGLMYINTGTAAAPTIASNGSAGGVGFNLTAAGPWEDSAALGTIIGTIPTTTNKIWQVTTVAPLAGTLSSASFSSTSGLILTAADYVTFSITNLTTGGGAVAMLAATDANTTKTTTGAAIVANAPRVLTVHGTAGNKVVVQGDRLLCRVTAVAGTALTNSLPAPIFSLHFV